MNELLIESTAQTPFISFNSQTGLMVIKGRSIPEDADLFWLPVLNWFESYIQTKPEKTLFRIDLEYFNITSSKRILFLLYQLNEAVKQNSKAEVEWYYRSDDEDMLEVGKDFAYMVRVPFEFIVIKEPELV
jgi:hypothetical protein